MRNVDFVFFDAGGGHRSAATALKTVIEQQGRPWRVRLVHLQDVLDKMDLFRQVTRIRMQDVYNLFLRKGWTLGSDKLLVVMHALIRLYHPLQVKYLERYWREQRPDMVVSVVPNFNRAIWQALQRVDPATPFVTILTDLADYPPHFWMERQPQYFICGTERAMEQARAMGHEPERLLRTSGMILRPMFYGVRELDVATERMALGLDPQRPTGLVLFGGHGAPVMKDIAQALQETARPLQLLLLCGKNEKLKAELERMPWKIPHHIVGFTDQVPRLMQMADFFIGKPGPGSISEALAMQLPVIVERNSWTLPQERYNADWVRERGVGLVVNQFGSEIRGAVEQLLEPEAYARFRSNAARVENRAVFEIPEYLEEILGWASAASR